MPVITNRLNPPPGGWSYTQEESGFKLHSYSLTDLLDRIEAHRRGNGYDLGEGWRDAVEMELCISHGVEDSHCRPSTTVSAPKEDRIRVEDLLRFFRTLREWKLKHRLQVVDMDEANRRASICASCPENKSVPGCPGCQGVLRHVVDLLGKRHGREVEVEDQLLSCGICHCNLNMKVHLPIDAIKAASPREHLPFPPHCWLADET